MAQQRSFLDEIKQRHVVRAAIIYAAAVWALAQGISQLSPAFGLAAGITFWFVIACVIGFPFWIAFALFFKFTSSGISREDEALRDAAAVHRTGRILDYWIIGILALAVVLLLTNELVLQRGKTLREFAAAPPTQPIAAQPIPAKSIAVLPFENLSNDKDNAYFVAGMQDLILTKLADVGGLKVIARTSTLQYGSHPENLTQIAEQLGVATILEGSVQKAGNQVLINVQLIDAQTDSHIWAESYTRTLDNIFGVEGEVAEQVATALNAKLSPAESARVANVPTKNAAAYDLFLHAEYQANRGNTNYDTASMKAAIPLYRQAVEQDPSFALAYARLSVVESQLAFFGGGGEDSNQLNQQARADAEQALKLAPNLAASQIALGYCDYYCTADFAGALKAFAAALKLKPNDADALAARAYVERREANVGAAIASLQQAFGLDPRNSALAFELGWTYMLASRYPEAEAALQHALAINPHNVAAKLRYAWAILYSTGDVARALHAATGDAPRLKLQRVYLLTLQRKYRAALALLDSVPDTPDNFAADVTNGSKAQQQADLYRLMRDPAKARLLYRQMLPAAHRQLTLLQGGNQAFVWLSIADAEFGLGQMQVGLQAIAKSLAIAGKGSDFEGRVQVMEGAAALYAKARRADLAVPLLAKALAMPITGNFYSPVLLWLDPAWDPIRHDPSFQALLKKYAKYKPAVTYDATPTTASASSAITQ